MSSFSWRYWISSRSPRRNFSAHFRDGFKVQRLERFISACSEPWGRFHKTAPPAKHPHLCQAQSISAFCTPSCPIVSSYRLSLPRFWFSRTASPSIWHFSKTLPPYLSPSTSLSVIFCSRLLLWGQPVSLSPPPGSRKIWISVKRSSQDVKW